MASNLNNKVAGSGMTTHPLTGLLLPHVVIQQRYRILEVLDSGEVSTLYKAEDMQLGQRCVALREIGRNNQNTQEALELIETERRELLLLADLSHPHLPRIYDYFVENQRWYFVQDFLVGETLETYLRKRKYRALPTAEVIEIGMQLATVLDYLNLQQPPYECNELRLSDIWHTPDGKLYLLNIGERSGATTVGSSSIERLGRILWQLQRGKRTILPRVPLPRLRSTKQGKLAKTAGPDQRVVVLSLKMLLRQMVQKDARKRLYTMGVVKHELQCLAEECLSMGTPKKGVFSRRTLLKLGPIVGLGGLAALSSWIVWEVEIQARGSIPEVAFSTHLGGTIYTQLADSPVLAIAWSPDGKRLAIGTQNGEVQSWDANTGGHRINYQNDNPNGSSIGQVYSLIWLPNGKSIVFGDDSTTVSVVNALTGEALRGYFGHTAGVISVANSPDGQYIASGGYDQTVQVWEVATGREIMRYLGHTAGIGSVAWSPDGMIIASASFDRTVQVWEVVTGRLLFTYKGHTDEVYTAVWSPDGRRIASGGKDQSVQVWSLAQLGRDVLFYRGHNKSVQALAWSPNGRIIASAGGDVQLWDSFNGKNSYTYTKHNTASQAEVVAVVWSPNGRYIASGGIEGTAQVWNAV